MKYLDMFLKLAQVAAEYEILVMMACHRLSPKAWPGDGLWYDDTITEARVLESWSMIAAKLCNQWNVFAVDRKLAPKIALSPATVCCCLLPLFAARRLLFSAHA